MNYSRDNMCAIKVQVSETLVDCAVLLLFREAVEVVNSHLQSGSSWGTDAS